MPDSGADEAEPGGGDFRLDIAMAPGKVVVDARIAVTLGRATAIGRAARRRRLVCGRGDEVIRVCEAGEVRCPGRIGIHHVEGLLANPVRHLEEDRVWSVAYIRVDRPQASHIPL